MRPAVLMLRMHSYSKDFNAGEFNEAQTALFKEPVRTAQ